MRISLAITHFNRADLLREAIAQVLDDPRVGEVVISDDVSDDGSLERLADAYRSAPKVRIYPNERRLDCYANKAAAVGRCWTPWVVLFDSDNVMTPAYLDALERAQPWLEDTAYLPTFAEPEFDYTAFEGLAVTRGTVAQHVDRPMFLTALNTANYLVHQDAYLSAWDPTVDPHTADSIYMNYRWLDGGGRLYFVPGLRYFHRIHDGSHFMTNHNRDHEKFKRSVEGRLRGMR